MQVNGELTQVISQPRHDKADNNNDDDNSKDDDDDDDEEEEDDDDDDYDDDHTSYLSQAPQRCLCKFFLLGVIFSRLNMKNWHFTV